MSTELLQKIEEGEHLHQDFKFAINDSKKIARSLAAFANTDGGRLLIGVKDNGNIVGVKTDEEFYMVEAAAEMHCTPPVKFSVTEHEVDDKTVLEVTILKDNQILHSAPDKDDIPTVYIRSFDENIQVNSIFVEAHNLKHSDEGIHFHVSRPTRKLFNYLKNNEVITFNDYCKLAKIRNKVATRILTELVALDIIDMGFTSTETYYHLRELPEELE